MKTITYNKLVRDRIPEIIEANGKKAVCETISNDKDYIKYLKDKLVEEMNEFLESDDVAELADMGEVMHALLEYKGVSVETFQRIRMEKLEKRGGFKKRILLKEVIEE
jgi:predicted house-cleaning noncanonical NTP pyrophosphatase (MazG superfamily)